jgi:predicted transposase YdaD
MKWDMAVLRESPWYQEILEEGIEQGFEQGIEQGVEQERQAMILRILHYRFGVNDPELAEQIRQLTVDQLQMAIDLAFEATSLEEVVGWVSKEVRQPNGNGKG